MKVLLIGGTGIISTAVSQLLVSQGHELFLLNRGSKNDKAPKGAKFIRADINNRAGVLKALDGMKFDSIAEFIAFTPDHIERDIQLFSGITAQYIFISSASTYQKPLSSARITESTPLANPYWEYSRNKIACEDRLMKEYRTNGFPVTIVRPSHTYDHYSLPLGLHGNKGSYQVLQRMLDGKPVIIHGDGTSLWTMTHNGDFAKGFVGLMGNIHALGEAVQITSDETLTWNQIYQCIADAADVKLKSVHIASEFLAACGTEYDFRGSLLGDKAVSVIFDNSKLKTLVPGFTAVKRFDQGVRETVRFVMDHPEYQVLDPEFDVWCDRVIAANAKAIESLN